LRVVDHVIERHVHISMIMSTITTQLGFVAGATLALQVGPHIEAT